MQLPKAQGCSLSDRVAASTAWVHGIAAWCRPRGLECTQIERCCLQGTGPGLAQPLALRLGRGVFCRVVALEQDHLQHSSGLLSAPGFQPQRYDVQQLSERGVALDIFDVN